MLRALLVLLIGASPAMAGDLVIIGDSVSAPSNAGAWVQGQGYGAIVASRSGMTEINLAVSGATSVQRASTPYIHDQWAAAIARTPKPAGIIAQIGENDIYWNPGVAAFKAQVDADVAAALAAGIPVTLNTTFHRQIPSSWYANAAPYVQAVREIGAARGVVVVDVFAWFAQLALTDAAYSSYFYTGDGINAHPTVAGQSVIASLFQLPQYSGAVGYSVPAPPPPAPIPAIPTMTAATTDGVTITGNDLNSTGTTTSAPVWMIRSNPAYTIQWNQGGGGWMEAQFPSAFVPKSYSMRARPDTAQYAPKSRTFQGWNGAGWDNLDQVSNEAAWSAGETRLQVITTTNAYSRYRINVTASQGGTYLQWREPQIYK